MRTRLLGLMCMVLMGQPCCAAKSSLQAARWDTLCRLDAHVARLDLMPQGPDGLTLRIVDPNISAVERRRRTELPARMPTGFRRIQIEAPAPTLAIVIDDLGLHPGPLMLFWSLGQPLTYAVLPHSPHATSHLEWLRERDAAVLVHVPLEPLDPAMMTFEGFLTLSQSPDTWASRLTELLARVPNAIGWSNHMGSRFTADKRATRRLVEATPEDLLILDSRTTVESHLAAVAHEMKHPVAVRQVFLDNVRKVDAIGERLLEALSIARQEGTAVAIGHPYPETAVAIRAFLDAHGDEVHLVTVDKISTPSTAADWSRRCAPVAQ